MDLQKYQEIMRLRNYSEPTIKKYSQHFQRFLKYYPKIRPEKITVSQIRDYIQYLIKTRKYSESSQNQAINALKIYFNDVLSRNIDEYYLPRPRRTKKILVVISENDVSIILKCITSIKEKCMISLIYSAGLTPSEIIYLKISDIDSEKMRIFISSAKGNKDRYVILSDKILRLLKDYYKKYKPDYCIFEDKNGKQCSKRTMQKVFQKAVIDSGINEKATLTILKNSFVIHLLEKGTDMRYIQKILGHKNIKTTEIYTHITSAGLTKIVCPFDRLDL